MTNSRLALFAVRLSLSDLDGVSALLADAGAALAVEGFLNWAVPYPDSALEGDIAAGVVWGVRDATDALVATFMLRDAPVHAYEGITWADASARAWYLNRMAVAPSRQGAGIGAWCLDEIARMARAEGIAAVRCDVLTENARLQGLYARHGYAARGERIHSGWGFIVRERQIANSE